VSSCYLGDQLGCKLQLTSRTCCSGRQILQVSPLDNQFTLLIRVLALIHPPMSPDYWTP
jgi:hypothetical protein